MKVNPLLRFAMPLPYATGNASAPDSSDRVLLHLIHQADCFDLLYDHRH